MAISIVAARQDADQAPKSVDVSELIDTLCTKAKHIDAVLTMLNSKDALSMLDEEGRSDVQWLLSDLAADAASAARQIQGATAL